MLPRYVVLVDGAPCGCGLPWCEAKRQANELVRLLSAAEPDECTVTISEMELGEPRLSWCWRGLFWECVTEPVWSQDAA